MPIGRFIPQNPRDGEEIGAPGILPKGVFGWERHSPEWRGSRRQASGWRFTESQSGDWRSLDVLKILIKHDVRNEYSSVGEKEHWKLESKK